MGAHFNPKSWLEIRPACPITIRRQRREFTERQPWTECSSLEGWFKVWLPGRESTILPPF